MRSDKSRQLFHDELPLAASSMLKRTAAPKSTSRLRRRNRQKLLLSKRNFGPLVIDDRASLFSGKR